MRADEQVETGQAETRSAAVEAAQALAQAIEARDPDRLTDLFAEDAVCWHPLSGELVGREAMRASEQALFDAFSEIDVQTRGVLSARGRVAVEVVLRATHTGSLDLGDGDALPPTGRRIELPSVWWLEIDDDGRIAAERDYLDTADFMRQLGIA